MVASRYSAFTLSTVLLFTGFSFHSKALADSLVEVVFSKAVDIVIDVGIAKLSRNQLETRLNNLNSELEELKESGQVSEQVQQAELLINSLYASNLNQGQPSFDCSKASVTLEFTICDNSGLSDIDGKMGLVYWSLIHSLPEHRAEQLKQEQLNWLKVRDSKCSASNVNCLLAAYQNRISELSWWAR